jgi:hypothetical protein
MLDGLLSTPAEAKIICEKNVRAWVLKNFKMFIFYIPGRAVAKNLPLLNSSANPAQFV